MQLTASEKKLVELYRAADSDTKKRAVSVLKGESSGAADVLGSLLGSAGSSSGKKDDILSSLLGGSGKNDILSSLLGMKREMPDGTEPEEPGEIPEADPLKEIKE